MLTSKQRAVLKGLASTAETILQVGKAGITPNLITQTADALKARELIKLKVLEASPFSPSEAARELALKTDAQVVQVIGMKMILYKPNPEKPIIKL